MNPDQAAYPREDRFDELLSAILSVLQDLDLEAVLQRIAATAAELVDCQYAALGVIGRDSTEPKLIEFVTTGVTQEQREAIGHTPHGRGILGLLIRQPQALRLHDLHDHPDSVGFPTHHPHMASFLGVPILIRDEIYGNLYLTEKAGGQDFNSADELVVTTLAAAAGIAIEHARLYAEAQQREQWQAASTKITRALLGGAETDEVLDLIADRARRLANADLAVIAFQDGDASVVEVACGLNEREVIGGPPPLQEPTISVPFAWRGGQTAMLSVTNYDGPDRRAQRFPPAVINLLHGFADQASIALELALARRDSEQFTVLQERDRIARDLHDTVIQRIFASGMHLEAIAKTAPESAARIQSVIDDLDQTIGEIRHSIFALQRVGRLAAEPLSERIQKLADQLSQLLGSQPSVEIDPLVDAVVPAELAEEVTAVVREGLSNIAKHAQAQRVQVRIELTDGVLHVSISDDGIGRGAASPNSSEAGRGLSNLAARAEARDGLFEVASPGTGGWSTTLSWSAVLESSG